MWTRLSTKHVTVVNMLKFGIMYLWNISKTKMENIAKLKQKNVDTGLGLERMAMLLQGKETPFDTEIFEPVMEKLVELQKVDNNRKQKNCGRTFTFKHDDNMQMEEDQAMLDRGYVLRRLIRRMVRHYK